MVEVIYITWTKKMEDEEMNANGGEDVRQNREV